MLRTWRWSALALCFAGVTVAVLADDGAAGFDGASRAAQLLAVLAGVALALVAAVLEPGTRGRLPLAWAGLAWLAAEWANPGAPGPLVFTVGLCSVGLALPLLLTALRPAARAVSTTLAWLAAILVGPVLAVVADPARTGCPGCPADLVGAAGASPSAAAVVVRAGAAATVLACAVGVPTILLRVARTRSLGPPARAVGLSRGVVSESAWPVAAGAVAVALVGVHAALWLRAPQLGLRGSEVRAWASVALLVQAVGATLPVLRSRTALRAVVRATSAADSVPSGSQDTLRVTLADDGLRVLLAVDGAWFDAQGRPGPAPPADRSTLLTRGALPIAALVHTAARLPSRAKVEAAAAGARLQLEADVIQAGESARASELRAARLRVVQAGDDSRVRLERDLHDGAQQRLVAVRYALGVAISRAQRQDAADLVPLLDEADAHVGRALDELRRLAHGDGGSTVETLGLREALGALVDGRGATLAPVLVGTGHAPVVARTVLAIVAAGLGIDGGNVSVVEADGAMRVEVRGTGLVTSELVDRVQLLGGTLVVHADRIEAVVPCG